MGAKGCGGAEWVVSSAPPEWVVSSAPPEGLAEAWLTLYFCTQNLCMHTCRGYPVGSGSVMRNLLMPRLRYQFGHRHLGLHK